MEKSSLARKYISLNNTIRPNTRLTSTLLIKLAKNLTLLLQKLSHNFQIILIRLNIARPPHRATKLDLVKYRTWEKEATFLS
jgi:hypothetical protein